MVPRIRAALAAGKPPLMFILGDPTRVEYSRWDIVLVNALHIHDDMMQGGVPLYWDRSERVRFTAEHYISKSRAALDAAEDKEKKKKTPTYGKVFYPKPHTTDENPLLPTLEEFLEEQRKKKEMSEGKVRFSNDPHDNAGWTPEP